MKSFIYYLLQVTYGILMNVIGILVFTVVVCFTHNIHRHYHSFYTITKTQFGGLSLGIFTISSTTSEQTLSHELGHSYQNIIFGPLFPFVVAIPSVIRYWYCTIAESKGKKFARDWYDSIWFEGTATRWGHAIYMKWSDKHGKA